MKVNSNTVISGSKVTLVPYRKEHVERYNAWMQDPFLLEMTASERLSLEEEYANQISWQTDETKLTFIILKRSESESASDHDVVEEVSALSISDPTERQSAGNTSSESISGDAGVTAHTRNMVGDVNMFINHIESDNGEEERVGELEIMIAEPSERRKGVAREAMLLFMHYVSQNFSDIKTLVVKISDTNTPSLQLFEKLGFVVYKHVEVFQETEMRYEISQAALEALLSHWTSKNASIGAYDH